MSRGNSQPTPHSAGRPSRPNDVVNSALADAHRMSHAQATTKPTPAAGPLIAPITGLARPSGNVKACRESCGRRRPTRHVDRPRAGGPVVVALGHDPNEGTRVRTRAEPPARAGQNDDAHVWIAVGGAQAPPVLVLHPRRPCVQPVRPVEHDERDAGLDFVASHPQVHAPYAALSVDTERRARFIADLKARGYERREEAFRLSSGGMSHDYVDCRRALADGGLLRLAGEVVADLIEAEGIAYDAVGGLTMGADPIAHAVALVTGGEWFSVRKEAKGHGQGRRVEGAEVGPGTRVVLVDDVVTTGRAIIDACDAVQEVKADIVLAVTLLDRSGKADSALADRGVRHVPVATWVDFGIDQL